MAPPLLKVLLILTIMFFVVDAKTKTKNKKINPPKFLTNHGKHKFPFFPFPDFFGNPEEENGGDKQENGGKEKEKEKNINVVPPPEKLEPKTPDFQTNYLGNWEVLSINSGVSAMQINLMPTNKIVVYDATIYRISRLSYRPGAPCVPFQDLRTRDTKQDCYAHAMEYDLDTNVARPLKVVTDPWCSCGGLTPDGTLLSAGGFLDGGKTLRYYGGPTCKDNNCDWREYPNALQEERWYGSQQLLPNGDFFVIGGRRSFSYEILPRKEGQRVDKPYFFPFLYETSDIDENNLYPFVHLSSDGNLFIFCNNRSLLLNPTTNKVVRTYPVLPGGSRNYPASGMSAMLPINLDNNNDPKTPIKVEVMVCGGNTHDAFNMAEAKKVHLPALQDCNRMVITDPKPKWENENMPSRRVMGDLMILPNGQLLFINGAEKGTAGWWDASQPNLTPVLYTPDKPKGQRFKNLKPTNIARMYHSTAALIPSGKIWIAGSNTHDTYRDQDQFPTETRVEGFSPPYLDANLDKYRPIIDEKASKPNLKYGANFETQFTIQNVENNKLTKKDIRVTMYAPPFTTHGVNMAQRLIFLKIDRVLELPQGGYRVTCKAPLNGNIAPPGYYILFVVHRGVPAAKGMWVRINK